MYSIGYQPEGETLTDIKKTTANKYTAIQQIMNSLLQKWGHILYKFEIMWYKNNNKISLYAQNLK